MPICTIKKRSVKAKVLQKTQLLFWDEISMMYKRELEAVNMSFMATSILWKV